MQHKQILYKNILMYKVSMGKNTQLSSENINQCTRLKMSADTLLPVLPPNWKLGVGNSCTNSNPVRQPAKFSG